MAMQRARCMAICIYSRNYGNFAASQRRISKQGKIMIRISRFEASLRSVCLAIVCVVMATTSALAQYTVSGKVLSSDNRGLPGASIQVLNSNLATATDDQGNFVLGEVPAGSHVIRVSAVGFAAENYTAVVEGNLTIDMPLNSIENRLDEAAVTARKMERDTNAI